MDPPDIRLPSTSSSPDRSISRVFSSRRRKQLADDSSSVSQHSNSLSVDRGSRLRSSIDRGIDKLGRSRSSRRGSQSIASSDGERRGSHDSTASPRKLSKILRTTTKRLRKKEDLADGEFPGLVHANTIAVDGSERRNNSNLDDLSPDSPDRGSIASSLLTDDSDPEPLPGAPLENRNSHTDLLTFSSPLIITETVEPSEDPLNNQTNAASGNGSGLGISAANGSEASPSIGNQAEQDKPSAEQTTGSGLGLLKTIFKDQKTEPSPTSPRVTSPKLVISPPTHIDIPSTQVIPATPDQTSTPFQTPPKSKPTVGASIPTTAHRRVRSAGPLKLSSFNPLTPAVEEVSTPGGTIVQPSQSAGFFSSVFSATQTAGSSFTNFFSVGGNTSRSRSGTVPNQAERTGPAGGEEVIFPASKESTAVAESAPREPAVATLGSGSLSLSHLGISEPSSVASMTSQDEYPDEIMGSPKSFAADVISASPPKRAEQNAAAVAVAAAYSEKRTRSSSTLLETLSNGNRPPSRSSGGENVTPPQSMANGKEGSVMRRTGSIRSKVSDKRKKQRNSSGANTSAIAAALAASHGAIANPAAHKPRLAGFPVASPKRNKDFHGLFKSVPDDDYLIEDYSAALQREILLHGRLYLSERYVCFSSNIMGYVTTLVINFDEIISLEKKTTAMIFPNAIVIHTLHAKNIFASLMNREATYEMILNIWKLKHPNIKPTDLGHTLDNSVEEEKGDVAEDSEDSDDDDEDETGDSEYDDEAGSYLDVEGVSVAGSDLPDRNGTTRVVSSSTAGLNTNGALAKTQAADGAAASNGAVDYPGPTTHAPTECTEADTHYDKMVLDDTIPAPLGKVYSMMFGPQSGVFMRKFLESQESSDIQYEDDKKGMDETTKSFSYSYIKKLSGSIGPKQTKCLITQTLDAFDLERSVSVTCSTQTPDVPSGNAFVTKTRYCLMWGPSNSTHILMSTCVEWSAKSWLKGPIEKGAEGGQAQHGKDLAALLRSQISSRLSGKGGKAGKKGKKKRSIGSPSSGAMARKEAAKASKSDGASDWGPLEPLHAILSPIIDTVGPLISLNVVLFILLITVTILWIRSSYSRTSDLTGNRAPMSRIQRLAAYEELWRREEDDLWSWLDERMKLDSIPGFEASSAAAVSTQQIMREKAAQKRLANQDSSERQISEAIRVTEEKLDALKKVVERKYPKGHDHW